MREVAEAAERIGDGDLTVEIAAHSNDEVGRMAGAFGRMTQSLRETAAAIAAGDLTRDVAPRSDRDVLGARAVAAVAESSSPASEQVSASAQQTSASTQEIAASAQALAAQAACLERLVGGFSV